MKLDAVHEIIDFLHDNDFLFNRIKTKLKLGVNLLRLFPVKSLSVQSVEAGDVLNILKVSEIFTKTIKFSKPLNVLTSCWFCLFVVVFCSAKIYINN